MSNQTLAKLRTTLGEYDERAKVAVRQGRVHEFMEKYGKNLVCHFFSPCAVVSFDFLD